MAMAMATILVGTLLSPTQMDLVSLTALAKP
jgi:hypothetical protein